ncbi:hypothetical protein D3Y59_04350 [Hymenobacter oligotrophus]|uniref:Uncharacterized protein n=2 Tax=Hymenobacter oligotrophus TaxID=2319843 RepID=A0A3B7RQA4_9BACT|nr:hypothetical protein D3Y59_04350 [Hymenobacter oligotrophus]
MKMDFRLIRLGLVPGMLLLALLAGCRTCPMVSCHVRKVHYHNQVKYRGQPIYKKQNPSIGEKIKVHNQPDGKMHNNRSKPKP